MAPRTIAREAFVNKLPTLEFPVTGGGGSTSTGRSGGPAPDSLSLLARASAAATGQSVSLRGPPTTQGMVANPSASGSPHSGYDKALCL